MWDEKSVYPKLETFYVFTPQKNDKKVETFNNQTCTQGSAS